MYRMNKKELNKILSSEDFTTMKSGYYFIINLKYIKENFMKIVRRLTMLKEAQE